MDTDNETYFKDFDKVNLSFIPHDDMLHAEVMTFCV